MATARRAALAFASVSIMSLNLLTLANVHILFLAIFEMKALLAALIRTFSFHDTGVELDFRVSVSLQAFVRGKLEEGPQIPLRVKLL